MKSSFSYFVTFVAALLLMGGCGGDDEPTPEPVTPVVYKLQVSPQNIKVPIQGIEQPIVIKTTAPSWEIALPDSPDWLHLSATSGTKGESVVMLTVEEHVGDKTRKTSLVVSAPECRDVTIQISQGAFDAERFYGGELSVAPDASEMGDKSAREIVAEMGMAWNLGYSLEAPEGEIAWGNIKTTAELISYIKSLGFNTVRVPVSWYAHADGHYNGYHIASDWFGRVNEIVRYCLDAGMFVMINEHLDSDAFNNLSADACEEQLQKCEELWRQIAIHYRDYDYHLIFAGFNENRHNTKLFGGKVDAPENYETQNLLLERFVKTVRETGGRNAYRYLAVQPYNANIHHLVSYMRLPEDTVENRLLVECHLYTPQSFCKLEEYAEWVGDELYMVLWDSYLPSNLNDPYYRLPQLESELQKFGDWCVEQGVGALLGEFSAVYHGDLAARWGVEEKHQQSRAWWHYHVGRLCRKHAICPMLWDNGDVTTTKCRGGYIDRRNRTVADPMTLEALFRGYRNENF